MDLTTAISLLRESELKQLKVKDDKPAIIGFINLGILEIYKRFVLWQAEATITMAADTYIYTIDGVDPNVTIDLSDHMFLQIDEAFDYDGDSMTINDESDALGLSTPKWNQVEIPPIGLTPLAEISLIYRAAPKFLTNEKAELPLPPQFYEALFHYVGYKGMAGTKGGDQTKDANNPFYKRFENSCDRVKIEGLYTEDTLESRKFELRGYV